MNLPTSGNIFSVETIVSQNTNLILNGGYILLSTPDAYKLVAAVSEGLTLLTAFDKALLEAGVGNCNLLKVSSILPPGAQNVGTLDIPEGVLLPIAYASMVSDTPGQRICAGVGIAHGGDGEYGVIMEYHGFGTKEEATDMLHGMLQEAFEVRGRSITASEVIAVGHEVIRCGCAFAAVPLWYMG